eukprot:scaffold10059_cov181-Skeletonema_marinoi.AAC.6
MNLCFVLLFVWWRCTNLDTRHHGKNLGKDFGKESLTRHTGSRIILPRTVPGTVGKCSWTRYLSALHQTGRQHASPNVVERPYTTSSMYS